METRSIQPEWCRKLPLQQQSVLLLAARGPDGIPKTHPCKDIQRAYRATVLLGAKPGRELLYGEQGDSFMCLRDFACVPEWTAQVDAFFESQDSLPHHFLMHILHGAEILGYSHPDEKFRSAWHSFYVRGCNEFHLHPETKEEMDERLSDWNQEDWDKSTSDYLLEVQWIDEIARIVGWRQGWATVHSNDPKNLIFYGADFSTALYQAKLTNLKKGSIAAIKVTVKDGTTIFFSMDAIFNPKDQ